MRLAILGVRKRQHENIILQGANQLEDVELVAIGDHDRASAEATKRDEPIAKNADLYTDWRHLLEHAMVDICALCGENDLRAEQIIALAERNIHIVAEKPLALTLADLARVRQAVAQSKSRLTMLLTMRHEGKYVRMRELVRQGTIGQPTQVTVQKSYRLGNRPEWFNHRKSLGGTIPYIGIHALDLVRWVTGLDFTHVAAFHGNLGNPNMKETENHASLALKLSNGGSASVHLDYLRPPPAPSHGDDRLRIAGTDGVIETIGADNEISLMTTSKKPHRIKPSASSNLFVEFVKALRENLSPRIPREDCFYATELVLMARDAADQGKVIQLSPPG